MEFVKFWYMRLVCIYIYWASKLDFTLSKLPPGNRKLEVELDYFFVWEESGGFRKQWANHFGGILSRTTCREAVKPCGLMITKAKLDRVPKSQPWQLQTHTVFLINVGHSHPGFSGTIRHQTQFFMGAIHIHWWCSKSLMYSINSGTCDTVGIEEKLPSKLSVWWT